MSVACALVYSSSPNTIPLNFWAIMTVIILHPLNRFLCYSHQQSPDEMIYSFLNNNDVNIMDDHRKLFIFILGKIDKFGSRLKNVKELNCQLEQKINDVEEKYVKLVSQNNKLNENLSSIEDCIYDAQCNNIQNDKYTCSENLIISGIPDNVLQKDLENEVMQIIRRIGLRRLRSYEIVACHRLNKRKNDKYPARTIVRFTNRKVVDFCLTH